jgi:hypothetical protein
MIVFLTYLGIYEVLRPKLSENGDLSLIPSDSGNINSLIHVMERNNTGSYIHWTESYESKNSIHTIDQDLCKVTRSYYQPSLLRTSSGNQFVGNTFTVCNTLEDNIKGNTYIAELGIKEGMQRVRVRYVYSHDALQSTSLPSESNLGYTLGLKGITIIRETLGEKSNLVYEKSAVGEGIYDPQIGGEPYVTICLPGKLSLLFPRVLRDKEKSVLTMEYIGERMRYQVDRIFHSLNEEIKTLELTEVRIDDAEVYPPGFLPRPEFLQ